jgi:serine/threonine protein kinase
MEENIALLLSFTDIPQPNIPTGNNLGMRPCRFWKEQEILSEIIPSMVLCCNSEYYALFDMRIATSKYGSIYEARKMDLITENGEDIYRETIERFPLVVKVNRLQLLPGRAGDEPFIFENPFREIAVMQHLRSLIETSHLMYQIISFATPRYLICIMPYYKPCNELFYYVRDHGHELDEVTAIRWFYQLVIGVYHLHTQGYVHLDLSLENVFLSASQSTNSSNSSQNDTNYHLLTIIDYGMMTIAERYGSRYHHLWYGKTQYSAPEIMSIDTIEPRIDVMNYDPSCGDIWALGIIFFVMIGKEMFVERADPFDIRFLFYQRAGSMENYLQQYLPHIHVSSNHVMDLLNGLLKIHPNDRLTIEQVIDHPCFRDI